MLLVMSLLGVLSATAIVGISRFQNSQPLNQAVEMLRIEFARTRTFAIDEGIPWVISRTDEHAFRRGPERNADDRSAKELRLPREVRAASADTIRFYPDGTVSGTTITLGESVNLNGWADDVDEGPDALDLTWRSSIDGLLDLPPRPAAGGATSGTSEPSLGSSACQSTGG